MSKEKIITGPHSNGGWQNKVSGAKKASSLHSTQAEAIAAGRKLAINRSCEQIIQGRNGRIRNCNSYGNDPCPPKDRK